MFRYLSYVLRHKLFVFTACLKMGLFWRGILHDLSKFRPSEFFPYMNHFYGKNSKAANRLSRFQDMRANEDTAFDLAWLKHIHRNPHHWQYWILQEDNGPVKLLKMPEKIAAEMICDWIGAGRAQGYYDNKHPMKEVRNWYQKNRGRILLASETRLFIDTILYPADTPAQDDKK